MDKTEDETEKDGIDGIIKKIQGIEEGRPLDMTLICRGSSVKKAEDLRGWFMYVRHTRADYGSMLNCNVLPTAAGERMEFQIRRKLAPDLEKRLIELLKPFRRDQLCSITAI